MKAAAEKSRENIFSIVSFPYDQLPDEPHAEKLWLENKNTLVRVPDIERKKVLADLVHLAKSNSSTLVLIHPAYRVNKAHKCILTEIAKENRILLLDFEDILTAECLRNRKKKEDYFIEGSIFHPKPEAHAILARALHEGILKEGLILRAGFDEGTGDLERE